MNEGMPQFNTEPEPNQEGTNEQLEELVANDERALQEVVQEESTGEAIPASVLKAHQALKLASAIAAAHLSGESTEQR